VSSGIWWLLAAVVLGIAELIAPGVFLIFLAAAAATVGVITLLFPDLPVVAQLLGFAGWAALAVLLGRRFYRDYPVESADPLLNDRMARLIGQTVIVTQAIEGGSGRVRVGDSEWLAHGPDLPAGTRVRVVGGAGAVLTVEPIKTLEIH
jgi:hypothetical protein